MFLLQYDETTSITAQDDHMPTSIPYRRSYEVKKWVKAFQKCREAGWRPASGNIDLTTTRASHSVFFDCRHCYYVSVEQMERFRTSLSPPRNARKCGNRNCINPHDPYHPLSNGKLPRCECQNSVWNIAFKIRCHFLFRIHRASR
jgi:hypothetical protein